MLPVSGSSPGSLTIPGAEMFPTQADGHTPSLGSNAKEKRCKNSQLKNNMQLKVIKILIPVVGSCGWLWVVAGGCGWLRVSSACSSAHCF